MKELKEGMTPKEMAEIMADNVMELVREMMKSKNPITTEFYTIQHKRTKLFYNWTRLVEVPVLFISKERAEQILWYEKTSWKTQEVIDILNDCEVIKIKIDYDNK